MADIAHTDELGSTTRESRVASDRDPSSSFRNPEVSAASGGHVTPDVRPASWLDEQRAQTQATRRVANRPTQPPGSVTNDGSRRRRIVVRRVRREVKRVDPVSVLRLSFFFYGVFMVVWLLLWAIIYAIAASAGLFASLRELGRKAVLPSLANLDVNLLTVEKWAFLSGLVIALLGAGFNALMALIYNAGSEMVGGVGVTFVEKDT